MNLQSKALRRERVSEEYKVYRAALEWNLTDPIVIESRDDVKSEARWRPHLNPFNHQVSNLITFCRRLPVTLLADDVGLGKTISAGLIVTELMSRGRVGKILIVCPKILGPQWQEELSSKFGLKSEVVTGSDLTSADPGDEGAIITTYQSAREHLPKIPEDRFDMLILDEAHKLRNLFGIPEPPKVAKVFRKALEARRFRFVLMLTATPIQNRLWDIYSLVDLMTVARGHNNPFGSPGVFARKFIEDDREKARKLKPEARDEFRSIVYGYMSRVRRRDAKLHFPERVVHMRKVPPTEAEQQILQTISKPLESMNRLAQISILQALTSSPEALSAQLRNMANKGTIPTELSATVSGIVKTMPPSAKLSGLAQLIEQLKSENPEKWRLVIFTGRKETQTTIELFLENAGFKVGIVNGSSGARNADTLKAFRENPPKLRIIVSTEAGAEGINLQVANMLVNYDLPWNPMIVEQRIGRIQRLASEHQNIAVFNVMLSGTFEEYIVGRLMEKLQMASHAIGDVESLLQGSGLAQENDEDASSFEEQLRALIMEALKGKDVAQEVKMREESIEQAKKALESESAEIDEMLGDMGDIPGSQPRCPDLPATHHSMTDREFILAALTLAGKTVTPDGSLYRLESANSREWIRFDAQESPHLPRSTYYAHGSAAFERLVDKVVSDSVHDVQDSDSNAASVAASMVRSWVESFGGHAKGIKARHIYRCFTGTATVRVRSTVAHDSYERLVDVPCVGDVHQREFREEGLAPISPRIEDPNYVGLQRDKVLEAAVLDPAIEEFSRFYMERRAIEMKAAGEDDHKRKKLEEEFTPRRETTLVGLQGSVYRKLWIRTTYTIQTNPTEYTTELTVIPSRRKLAELPAMSKCVVTGASVPSDCLDTCAITGDRVLKHLLRQSEVSARCARSDYFVKCSLSGKSVIKDEISTSDVSGRPVATELLKTSAISGKLAEPQYMGACEFTSVQVLKNELAISQLSGKSFRSDQQKSSGLSGLTGHQSEFVKCSETDTPLAVNEAEQCEVTHKYVRPGILEKCAITGKSVLLSELERCVVTGQKAIKRCLVSSSISGARVTEGIAVVSSIGKFCLPSEAKTCEWSLTVSHPDDVRQCSLTGLTIHSSYYRDTPIPALSPLATLLDGTDRSTDARAEWAQIVTAFPAQYRKVSLESAKFSPDRGLIAISFSVKRLMGLRTRVVGCLFDSHKAKVIGRIIEGQRSDGTWHRS